MEISLKRTSKWSTPMKLDEQLVSFKEEKDCARCIYPGKELRALIRANTAPYQFAPALSQTGFGLGLTPVPPIRTISGLATLASGIAMDPLAAEDLLLSWYSLYQPRPAQAPMLAAMSTLMMPAATVALAGHPAALAIAQPKHDLVQQPLPTATPITTLSIKTIHNNNSSNGTSKPAA
ncbi:hypothetical protein QYM36_010908 [Artemia franciscana]|uniref:Uncharacterized protein n=1 Tax=Artemia franciscana TaxID=6661 RepID=A0AA88L0M5_ARTSF|nr:hypothetical protein QYM36_010908 [Artemia franciscana]